jgi:hypothetical protein
MDAGASVEGSGTSWSIGLVFDVPTETAQEISRLGWLLGGSCGRGWTDCCRLDDVCSPGNPAVPSGGQLRLP